MTSINQHNQPIISGKTRLVGLLGWPVDHSLSPAMQNPALLDCGVDAVYVPLAVEPSRIGDAVRGLRALGFVGANVTIPHKVAVLDFLDDLTPEARAIGAVNTIKVEADGRLLGHNTDCLGAVRALQQAGAVLQGSDVAVLGAGGAGRGVAAGCALAGARRIVILNRSVEKAEEICRELAVSIPGARAIEWVAAPLASATTLNWTATKAVFQVTSLGMKGDPNMAIDPALLPVDCHVLESVYAPLETPFLKAARARGLPVTDGLAMLIEQGALAFEYWFGKAPDRSVMRRALVAARSNS